MNPIELDLGYACINQSLKDRFRACRADYIPIKGLSYVRDRALHNFRLTKKILEWNLENEIYFYRITSEMIPFATHAYVRELLSWDYQSDSELLSICSEIRELVITNGIRLTSHPGQYTVLSNFDNPKVVENSIRDLHYHDWMLSQLGGSDMILHVGGVYRDRPRAMSTFLRNYSLLPDSILQRLRIENDDRSYTVEDVLFLSREYQTATGKPIPILLDYHHDRCLPSSKFLLHYIEDIYTTWTLSGLSKQKVHLSTGRDFYEDRRHHDYIDPNDLEVFVSLFEDINLPIPSIMLECKEKNLALLRLRQQLV